MHIISYLFIFQIGGTHGSDYHSVLYFMNSHVVFTTSSTKLILSAFRTCCTFSRGSVRLSDRLELKILTHSWLLSCPRQYCGLNQPRTPHCGEMNKREVHPDLNFKVFSPGAKFFFCLGQNPWLSHQGFQPYSYLNYKLHFCEFIIFQILTMGWFKLLSSRTSLQARGRDFGHGILNCLPCPVGPFAWLPVPLFLYSDLQQNHMGRWVRCGLALQKKSDCWTWQTVKSAVFTADLTISGVDNFVLELEICPRTELFRMHLQCMFGLKCER